MGVNGYVSRRQNGTTGYLFKDAHGDILSIYTSTSNKAADTMHGEKYEQKMNQVLLKITHYATMVNITIMKVI